MTERLATTTVDAPPLLTDFAPYNEAFRADPYPEYDRIRGMDGPVLWDYLESYLVSSYADAASVLANPRIVVEPPPHVAEALAAIVPDSLAPMQRTVLFRDPPDHDRLRNLTRRALAAHALTDALAGARATLSGILARAVRRGQLEVVDELAFPVALQVVGDLLGVPRSDLPMLRDWGQRMSPAADIPAAPGAVEQAVEAFEAFDDYFGRLAERRLAERRLAERDPGTASGDLFATLMRAQADELISRSEAHASATLLFISGHETLVAFMASAFLNLVRHRDQLALLRRRPELAGNAVDEVLRYESPLQLATAGGGRWTTEDTVIGGRLVPAGQRVLTLIGAANRDPAAYRDPASLDITRPGIRHLALGHGLHYCLGAVLAKAEGQLVLEALAGWHADLELIEERPRWLPLFMQRRLAALPLRVSF
jgi:pimeloyl-[acyl-carrier protein] synthase